MASDKIYRLFISHSWKYDNEYYKIVELIDRQGLNYYNHSVPIHDPIFTNGTDKELRAAIDAKIRGASCVIILAGVYATYSKWINIEIDLANKYGKPIIAVEKWGSIYTSAEVKAHAHKIVRWQGSSIVNAIKELG